MNPELRQTLNTISRNFESAGETAQENIFTFTQLVIDPCVNGFKSCVFDCASICFPQREIRFRRRRAQSRGRSDLHFDFYDDWDDDEDENYGHSPWANDELDSLLAGRGSRSGQPGRQRAMSYGTRHRRPAHAPGEDNPNIIPSSSYLGFLERFKWRPGAKGVLYKPSAADLQEHPGTTPLQRDEAEPLIEEDSEDDIHIPDTRSRKHKRQRSDTEASRSTTNSLSSRGDLIMGDEEDDAIPLDDEFAVILTRQQTGGSKRPSASRKSTRTVSNKSTQSTQSKRSDSSKSLEPIPGSPEIDRSEVEPPSMAALRAEEDNLREEQEMEIAQKREAAERLAKERGLESDMVDSAESIEVKDAEGAFVNNNDSTFPPPSMNQPMPLRSPTSDIIEPQFRVASPLSSNAEYAADSETEPFPSLPTTPFRENRDLDHPP